MSLQELFAILNTGAFQNKVAYRAFPVGHAPALPFICYRATDTDNYKADNVVYKVRQFVDVELYTATKDISAETALEQIFNNAEITWDKDEDYIESEDMYQITYEVSI